MTEDHLRLRVGEKLFLQRTIGGVDERYTVKVIGYLQGESLIVTAPEVKGKVLFMREGQRFTVRMLDERNALGFVSTVIHTVSRPYPYLHLEYPHDWERATVRNAGRIRTSVPALAKSKDKPDFGGNWQPVMIRDLSTTGACFDSMNDLGQSGERIELKFNLTVRNLEENVMLMAIIRNVTDVKTTASKRTRARYKFGVQFFEVNRFRELLISHYILERMVDLD